MPRLKEPPIISDINRLHPDFKLKVERLIASMKALGYDPKVVETLRTPERQQWLYGIGRTHQLRRRPVTWTLKSKHLEGKAVDIISRKYGYNNPGFFVALHREAEKLGLKTLGMYDAAHIEYPD